MKFDPEILIGFLIAANLLGAAVFVLTVKRKSLRKRAKIAAISTSLTDYFRRSGVTVSADCIALETQGRYAAIIESEPMKRFRLSHLIEIALREHVRKTCNLELDKVYWRFPIKEATHAAAAGAGVSDHKPAPNNDEYINEGLEQYKYIPKVEVTELPWEEFEVASTADPKNHSTVDLDKPKP